jgi:hypothetical protein
VSNKGRLLAFWKDSLRVGGILVLPGLVGAIVATAAVSAALLVDLTRPLIALRSSKVVSITCGEQSRMSMPTPCLMSFPQAVELIRDNSTFAAASYYREVATSATTGQGAPISLVIVRASPSFFSVLEATPAHGRTFSANDATYGNPNVLVLSSEGCAKLKLNAATAIGRVVLIGAEHYVIVGVMRRDFRVPSPATEAWVIDRLTIRQMEQGGVRDVAVVARSKVGVSRATLAADLGRLQRQLSIGSEQSRSAVDLRATPMKLLLLGTDGGLVALFALISSILATTAVCGTLVEADSFLSIYRFPSHLEHDRPQRLRETWWQLRWLLSCYLIVATLAVFGEIQWVHRSDIFSLSPLEEHMLAVHAGAASALILLLIVYALIYSHEKGASQIALWENRRRHTHDVVRHAVRALLILIAASAIISVVLQSHSILESKRHLGFNISGLIAERPFKLRKNGVAEVHRPAGETEIAQSGQVPLMGDSQLAIIRSSKADGQPIIGETDEVSSNYFSLMQIPLRSGREFDKTDNSNVQCVVVVNSRLAKALQISAGANEQFVDVSSFSSKRLRCEVIGIVADVRDVSVWREVSPKVYLQSLRNGSDAEVLLYRRHQPLSKELIHKVAVMLNKRRTEATSGYLSIEDAFEVSWQRSLALIFWECIIAILTILLLLFEILTRRHRQITRDNRQEHHEIGKLGIPHVQTD